MARRVQPAYARIEADLRHAIAAGEWPVGDRLPSEGQLCGRYGVSRMTVRQALERLAAAGLVAKQQGVGTFVARTKIERVASRLLGFREDTLAHGQRPSTRVLSVQTTAAGDADAHLLGLDPADEVLRVARLRATDDEPIALNEVVVAPAFVRALADLDFTQSFYDGAARLLGVEVGRAEQTVESVHPPAGAAELLGVPPTDPLLRITRVTFLADGRLLGLTRSHYRGDRYFLSLTVHRTESDMSG